MKEFLEYKSDFKKNINEYKSLKTIEEKEQFFEKLAIENEDVKIQNLILQERVAVLQSRKFSRKTEKLGDGYIQISLFENSDLFNEAETIKDEEKYKPEEDEYIQVTYMRKTGKKKNKANLDNENIYKVVVDHRFEGDDLNCPKCNQEMNEMGHKEVRCYNFIPARLELNVHNEYAYKCNDCSKGDKAVIKTAKRLTSFPKYMVEDSFVSNIIVEKYLKYVPLFRQEKVFNNMGLDLNRSSLSKMVIKASSVLEPIYDLIYKNIIKSDICHMDETPLRVISNEENHSYIWGLASSKHDHPAFIYIYKPNRKHENARNILKGFKGYAHSDAYGAYKSIENTINVGCFAHARRKFVEILKASEKGSTPHNLSLEGKKYIDRLYSIEHKAKRNKLSVDEIFELRQTKSLKIINEYEEWLHNNPYKEYRQTIITKAINYSINALPELKNYLKDGRLEIDNNRAERMMKSFVIGRKNFLFSFSESGAEASVILYSIIETAYANNLRIEQYLTYLFKTIAKVNKVQLDDENKEKELLNLLPYSDQLPEGLKIKQK